MTTDGYYAFCKKIMATSRKYWTSYKAVMGKSTQNKQFQLFSSSWAYQLILTNHIKHVHNHMHVLWIERSVLSQKIYFIIATKMLVCQYYFKNQIMHCKYKMCIEYILLVVLEMVIYLYSICTGLHSRWYTLIVYVQDFTLRKQGEKTFAKDLRHVHLIQIWIFKYVYTCTPFFMTIVITYLVCLI